jgi:hypothetical protein
LGADRLGFLISKDEFITAERLREMLLLGHGAVRDNFEVSFVKPPLQYCSRLSRCHVLKGRRRDDSTGSGAIHLLASEPVLIGFV